MISPEPGYNNLSNRDHVEGIYSDTTSTFQSEFQSTRQYCEEEHQSRASDTVIFGTCPKNYHTYAHQIPT